MAKSWYSIWEMNIQGLLILVLLLLFILQVFIINVNFFKKLKAPNSLHIYWQSIQFHISNRSLCYLETPQCHPSVRTQCFPDSLKHKTVLRHSVNALEILRLHLSKEKTILNPTFHRQTSTKTNERWFAETHYWQKRTSPSIKNKPKHWKDTLDTLKTITSRGQGQGDQNLSMTTF